MSRSAAQMWCPICKDYTACKSIIPPRQGEPGNRFSLHDHDDLQFFRRFRQCVECGEDFETAEIDIDFLHELGRLRTNVAVLRAQLQLVESHFKEGLKQFRKLEKELPKVQSEKLAGAGVAPLA